MNKNILFFTIAAFSIAASQNKSPLWDSEADFRSYEPKVLELIEKFKKDPIGPEAEKTRYIVNRWATETPYIGFTRYKKYLSELDQENPYYLTLFDGYSFGEIELKLKNKGDYKEGEIAHASLKSMLNVYGKIMESDPSIRNGTLDKYIELEKAGKLLKHFDSIRISGSEVRSKDLPAFYAEFDYGIKIKNAEEKKVKLKEWKKRDFLILYVSAGCPHCRELAKRMKAQGNPKIELVLIFSRLNSSGQIREFFENTKVDFKPFYDYDGQFAKEYGGGIVPVAILVKKDGSAIRAAGGEQQKVDEIIEASNKL